VVTAAYEFPNYAPIDGIMIPSPWIRVVAKNAATFDFKVHLNVPYRDEVFKRPPSPADGPYAWRVDEK
jgi:hypothetical protein